MPWNALITYLAVLAAAVACGLLARLGRLPTPLVALAVGFGLGRPGANLVPVSVLQVALPVVMFHVAAVLGVVGYRLGQGMLRLPLGEILRRSLPPLLLATVWLGTASFLLPVLLPGAAGDRSFFRFIFPLACVTAVFPLLSLRDVFGRAPADAGSIFFVSAALVGAAYSFTPSMLWSHASPGTIWRQPLLVLVESGALGVMSALAWVALTRRARLPRVPVTLLVAAAALEVSFSQKLWPPFTTLGFGAVLGKTGVPEWRIPGARAIFSEAPFVLIVAAAFAPDLWSESVAAALLNLAALALLVTLVRAKATGGRALVTGPGLLFLGLTLTVRLDRGMGPVSRYVEDLALPAWAGVRMLMWGLTRRAAIRPARSRPTSTPRTSPSGDPPRTRGSGPA